MHKRLNYCFMRVSVVLSSFWILLDTCTWFEFQMISHDFHYYIKKNDKYPRETYYYMANSVLGKSLRSDWFFLGQNFAYGPFSWKRSNPCILLWSEAGKFKISNQNSEKETVNIVILHSETTRRS